MKLSFKYLSKKDVVMFIISCLSVVFQVLLELKIPEYTAKITVLVQTSGVTISDVMVPASLMLACALGSLTLFIISGYLLASVGTNATAGIRADLYRKIMSFSLQEMSAYDTSSIITRCTVNVEMILRFWISGPLLFVRAGVTLVLAIIKMSNTDIRWLYTVGTAAIAALILMMVLLLIAAIRMVDVQMFTDNMNRLVGEHMSGIRVMHAFNAYRHQRKIFDETNDKLTAFNTFVNNIMSILMPGLLMITYALTISIFVMGGYIISGSPVEGRANLYASMIEFSSYATIIMGAVVSIIKGMVTVPAVIVSSKRINEVLEDEIVITDGKGAEKDKKAPAISFEHVSFKYPQSASNILNDISFKAGQGETVAFIGNTGCGKTTLLNLIPRLYDADDGSIKICGDDIKDYTIEELRNMIGYVPQKARLFSGSIADNIDFGDDGGYAKSLNEIKKAAKVGQADEFIMQKPEGYDTMVQGSGTNFSGGQRQRLTISRAVCRDPEIYLFDDSFSALDFKTDRELRKALKKNAAGATVIIVAQRISTIRNADRIYVMDKGRIVGEGTHDELLETCDVYKEIAYTQIEGMTGGQKGA
ncbi:MAG: ABC transporter ATP-binding protein [Eubacterium sp.]|nr:ABC transporter ATP-binding protein [Eubacterium sp.]